MGEREWKQALFAYVNQYNRSEVNGAPQPDEYLEVGQRMERAARTARLEQWYNERNAVPLRSETRAKPLRIVQDTPEEAVVDVQLHVRLFYEKGGMTHREDRIERERLTFTREGEAWQVARIERDPAERKPAGERFLLNRLRLIRRESAAAESRCTRLWLISTPQPISPRRGGSLCGSMVG